MTAQTLSSDAPVRWFADQEGASALSEGAGEAEGSNTASNGTPQEGRGEAAAAEASAGGQAGGEGQSVTLNLEQIKDQLPHDLANDNDLIAYGDVPQALRALKSSREAMSMKPEEVLRKPTDPGDPSQLQELAQKLGAPASADEFKLENPKDSEGNPIQSVTPDQELSQEFMQKAHEQGLLPQQAQALFDWFGQRIEGSQQQSQQQAQQQVEQAKQTLTQEWGEAFQQKMSKARIAVEQLGGQDLMQTLEKTGAANDPTVIKALAQVGGMLSEDGGMNPAATTGASNNAQTPAQLRSEAKRLEEQALNASSSRERREMLEQARQQRERAAKFG